MPDDARYLDTTFTNVGGRMIAVVGYVVYASDRQAVAEALRPAAEVGQRFAGSAMIDSSFKCISISSVLVAAGQWNVSCLFEQVD